MHESSEFAFDPHAVVDCLLTALPDLELLYLFGSTARGDAHARSDVDLAFLAGVQLAPEARFRLQERVAALLHRDVDLVDLRSASTVMRVQVVDGGSVLYARNEATRDRFEMTAFSAYARLNEERRGILEDVRERGTVHG